MNLSDFKIGLIEEIIEVTHQISLKVKKTQIFLLKLDVIFLVALMLSKCFMMLGER
jgi:hypothetical protein